MNSRSNWAKEEAIRIINAEGFRDTPADVIAAALQGVADQCAEIVEDMPLDTPLPDGDRTAANQFHYSQAIRARFPREGA